MRAKYVLSEVAVGLWRNVTMTVAMIITMAVSLGLLGSSLLMYTQVSKMKDFFRDDVQVSIFLKQDVTAEQRDAIKTELESDPGIKHPVDYESKEAAFKRFQDQFKAAPELIAATKPEVLNESFRVKLKNPDQHADIAKKYRENHEGVDSVVDQRELLSKLFNILGSLQTLGLIIAGIQGLAALLLVGNTIQVAAYSKRREVSVMKLVGAANWFIQAPFVLEVIFAGLIGAVVAFGALAAGKIFVIDGTLKPLASIMPPVAWSDVLVMLPVLAGVAAVVSAVAAWITLRFQIKM